MCEIAQSTEENVVYFANIELIGINTIYKMSVSVYFLRAKKLTSHFYI